MSTLVRIPPPALVSVSSFSFGSGVLHQTELRARAEVGVLVRALRRLVTELGLYGLDGVTGCRGLPPVPTSPETFLA